MAAAINDGEYQLLNALLLNEIQRQHGDLARLHAEMRAVVDKNQDLEQRLAALEAALALRRE